MTMDPKALELLEKSNKKTASILKLFDIKEFVIDPNKTEEANVPLLNRKVKFKRLVIGDLFDLSESKNRHEYSAKLIWKMLSKVDPEITLEQISNLPPDVASAIFDVLAEKIVFLPQKEPKATSESGSTKT